MVVIATKHRENLRILDQNSVADEPGVYRVYL